MEEREHLAFIILVENCGQLVVDAVHIILALIIADVPTVRCPIRIQHSTITVKAAGFLLNENDVVKSSDARPWSRRRRWAGSWVRRRSGRGVWRRSWVRSRCWRRGWRSRN